METRTREITKRYFLKHETYIKSTCIILLQRMKSCTWTGFAWEVFKEQGNAQNEGKANWWRPDSVSMYSRTKRQKAEWATCRVIWTSEHRATWPLPVEWPYNTHNITPLSPHSVYPFMSSSTVCDSVFCTSSIYNLSPPQQCKFY